MGPGVVDALQSRSVGFESVPSSKMGEYGSDSFSAEDMNSMTRQLQKPQRMTVPSASAATTSLNSTGCRSTSPRGGVSDTHGEPQQDDAGRAEERARQTGRSTTSSMDAPRDEGKSHGTAGRRGDLPSFAAPGEDQRASQGGQEKGGSHRVLPGAGVQRDDGGHGDEGHSEVAGGVSSQPLRPCGIRQAQRQEVSDDPDGVRGVRPLGRSDVPRGPGGQGHRPAVATTGQVADRAIGHDQRADGQGQHGPEARPEVQLRAKAADDATEQYYIGTNSEQFGGTNGSDGSGAEPPSGSDGRCDRDVAQRADGSSWGAASQGSREEERRCGHDGRLLQHGVVEYHSGEMSSPDEGDGEELPPIRSASQRLADQLKRPDRDVKLPGAQARRLEEQSWRVVPSLFQDLVGHRRPLLMECSHRPDRFLTETLREMTGKEQSAVNTHHWSCEELSGDAGVRRMRERLESESPQHVWFSPACEAFSPSQHVHQKTDQQQKELGERRRELVKQFVGMSCIVHLAIQQGIHVSVEMPAKNDAWRLPVLQSLRNKYQLMFVTAQGCMLNQHNSQGLPTRQGWSVLTTHQRLARMCDLPCRCGRHVAHGKPEVQATMEVQRCPKELAHRICHAIQQEGSHHEVVEECSGKTQLMESFGEGEFCACMDVSLPFQSRKCAMCVSSRCRTLNLPKESPESETQTEDPEDPVMELTENQVEAETCNYSQEEINSLELEAQNLEAQKDYRHCICQRFLEKLPNKPRQQHRDAIVDKIGNVIVIGAYAHGNHYGITQWTRKLPRSSRYLLSYMKYWSPEAVHCSSLFINKDRVFRMHKDNHNQPGSMNYIIGVTRFQQGEMWIEGPGSSPGCRTVYRKDPSGHQLAGHLRSVRQKVLVFDARKWHEPQKWHGQRWLVGAYTSRGYVHLNPEDKQFLKELGMVPPPATPPQGRKEQANACEEEAMAGEVKRKEIEEIKRKLYLLHAATGHGSTKHMVEALKRRKASPLVLQLAQEFKCSICQEKGKVQPRQVASLEPLPPKFHTISADVGHWVHPATGEHQNFMVIIDEGSRFRMARILVKGQKQAPTTAACTNYLQEGWFRCLGSHEPFAWTLLGVSDQEPLRVSATATVYIMM